MDEKQKIQISHYKFEIILITLIFIVILLHKLCSSLFYISGSRGNIFYFFPLNILLILLLLGLFITLLILALINLVRIIIKACKSKKVVWLRTSFSILPFLICIFLFFNTKPGAFYFIQGYEKWVHKEVDIASIQKWLGSLDVAYSEKCYFEAKEFPEELPVAITKLEPYHMSFTKFDAENRGVELEWGCAFGHFGIIIGLPGMETPREGSIKISENTWEYRRPIQSAVYIFTRG